MKYVLPVILGTGIIVFLVWYFTDYRLGIDGCAGKISFDRFLLFYEIEPKHWDLCPSWVKYEAEQDFFISNDHYVCGYLYFSVIDTWRYQIWKRNGEKVKNTARNNKNYQRILESINADIEKFREKGINE